MVLHCDSLNDEAFLETALQALSAMPDFHISIEARDLYDCAPAYTGCVELTLGIKRGGNMTQRMALITGRSSGIGSGRAMAQLLAENG